MNDAIADLFNIDVVLESVHGDDKALGDRVTGGIVERQVDYMVEGMHGNAGGVPGRNDTGCTVGMLQCRDTSIIVMWDVVWAQQLGQGRGHVSCRQGRSEDSLGRTRLDTSTWRE